MSFPSQPPYTNCWQVPSVALYHHRGMEARHRPTTSETRQKSKIGKIVSVTDDPAAKDPNAGGGSPGLRRSLPLAGWQAHTHGDANPASQPCCCFCSVPVRSVTRTQPAQKCDGKADPRTLLSAAQPTCPLHTEIPARAPEKVPAPAPGFPAGPRGCTKALLTATSAHHGASPPYAV